MRIPTDVAARVAFVQDVVGKCMASRESRRAAYRTLRQFYLYGAEESSESTVNQIYPHLDKVCSYLYASDTTRFSVDIARSVNRDELMKVPALNQAVHDLWHDTDTDTLYGEALLWALVYGKTHIKARPQGQSVIPSIVFPHDFGVWREDCPKLLEQEAFVQEYRMPKTQLESDLKLIEMDPARIASILARSTENSDAPADENARPMQRVIVSSSDPDTSGDVASDPGATLSYMPTVDVPMVRMYELYVLDDALGDYRVFTVAHPFEPIFDRSIATMFMDGTVPFREVCPYPLPDYYFGTALVERLMGLQRMRNRRWGQIQHMMDKQARPPWVAEGEFADNAEEISDIIDTPSGGVISGTQGSKLSLLTPEIPSDLFAEISYIDEQFEMVTGTTNIMSGKGEAGVRSESHANQLLRVGASRAKRRALIVEDQIEELATLYLRILRKYSTEKYLTETDAHGKQMEFTAAQFTDKFRVSVDAHSSSPVFMSDMTQIAFALFKAKAITREQLIDMLSIPMKGLLKFDLKTKIEPAEAAEAAKAEQLELATGGKAPLRAVKR